MLPHVQENHSQLGVVVVAFLHPPILLIHQIPNLLKGLQHQCQILCAFPRHVNYVLELHAKAALAVVKVALAVAAVDVQASRQLTPIALKQFIVG